MKILFVSMPSIHATRWAEQLVGEGHELFWFDILNRGKADFHKEVVQFTGWRKNKVPLRGKSTLKRLFPVLYAKLQSRIEVTIVQAFTGIMEEIQPDILHSFEMQNCTAPLLKVMLQYPSCYWLYSCWGSDLYHFRKEPKEEQLLRTVLERIDSIHTDCQRDFQIATSLGFSGKHFGIFPGGGGYSISKFATEKKAVANRNTIVLKGYQHNFGKALIVIEAFKSMPISLANYRLEVFSAHSEVVDSCRELDQVFSEVKVHNRLTKLTQKDMMTMMGRGLLYIGNSISDGMPNTLLEAMIMGAFPLQSNPGGVTEEVIEDGKNGLLIASPENPAYIAERIEKALNDPKMISEAFNRNAELSQRWEFEKIKKDVLEAYNQIILRK